MSSELDELVQSARRHSLGPTPSQRTAVKRSVLAFTSLGAATAAATSVTKLMFVGLVSVAVGATSTIGIMKAVSLAPAGGEGLPVRRSEKADTKEPIAKPNSQSQPTPAPQAQEIQLPQAPAPAPRAQQTEPPPTPRVPDDVPTDDIPTASAGRTPSPSRLSSELSLMRVAAEAVDAKNFEAANTALESYESQFRDGVFSTEAGVLRVLIQCAAGQETEAVARATELIRRDPKSPMTQRLRTSCAAAAFQSDASP